MTENVYALGLTAAGGAGSGGFGDDDDDGVDDSDEDDDDDDDDNDDNEKSKKEKERKKGNGVRRLMVEASEEKDKKTAGRNEGRRNKNNPISTPYTQTHTPYTANFTHAYMSDQSKM